MKVIRGIMTGLIAYVVTDYAMDALITGTSAGETIMTTLVPIAIGAGTVMIALGLSGMSGRNPQV